MSFGAEFMGAAQATDLLRPTDTFAVPLGPGQPSDFLHALGDRDDWEALTIFGALLVDLYSVFTKPGVRYLSGFFGPAERFLVDTGANVEFVPADFRRFGPIATRLAPRVMATLATPPDADGYMSLSLHSGATASALHACGADPSRVLIVECNAMSPRTLGFGEHEHRLHVSEADALIESNRPLFTIADAPPTEAEIAIASFALSYIPNGATLQTGIGGVPAQVVKMLAEHGGGYYGIHSEMFTTALMSLHQAGKVTNQSKGQFDNVSVTTFAAGTAELYEWLDNNTAVRFLPVDIVNAPEIIGRNRNMITINGALAVDLNGQVIADTIDGKQFSGIGGHEDFVSAAGLGLDDRSLICLASTVTIDGKLASRIGPFAAGAVITTPRHQLDVVITEFGTAELRGRTVRERGEALANIAHPDFRDQLLAAIK